MKNKNSNWVVTLFLICVLILVRFLAEFNGITNCIVCVINLFALIYVIYCIYSALKSEIGKNKESNKIYMLRYNVLNSYMKIIIMAIFFGGAIYILLMCLFKKVNEFGSCINDMIAIVSLGLSIEDDSIYSIILSRIKRLA